MKLSIVIPLYNEEQNIPTLYVRILNALKVVTEDFEIICVNDGSTDNTDGELYKCHKSDARFKVISLSRNFGHQAAYTAGLDYARGDVVGMMDGDLQDPPELFAEMLRKIETERFDVVYGKRTAYKMKAINQVLTRGFHFLFKRILRVEDIENVGNFALMTRRALNALLLIKEKNRYLPGLRSFIGFRQTEIYYQRQERNAGCAKMTLCKLFKLAFDAIFAFSDLPIKICLYSGLSGMVICFIAFIYILLSKLLNIAPFGWSSTNLAIFFFGFIQMIFLGVIGEYLFRVYRESQARPLYIIREIIE